MSTRLPDGSIPSLDGLRCVAILPVFVSHVLMAAGLRSFVPGNFGVTLFFFLSGYLITTLMRLEMERTGRVNFGQFYLRRSLRIFPAAYLVLGLAALYGWSQGTAEGWWVLGQALHLTNYQIIHGGWQAPIAPNTDVYWSLAVEEHFYLFFPLVFVALAGVGSRGRRAAVLLAACAAVFAWRCWLTWQGASPDRTYLGTDTRIDSILFGCVLALWGNPALDPTRIAERTWTRVIFPLCVAGILLTFLGDRAFRETFGYSLQGLFLFGVFIPAVRYPGWGPMRLLNLRAVRYVGLLSYAIYLVHPSFIHIGRLLAGDSVAALFALSLAGTLAAAAAIHHGIERPVARLRSRLGVANNPSKTREADRNAVLG